MLFELIKVDEYGCEYSFTCVFCNKKIDLDAVVDEYTYYENKIPLSYTKSLQKTLKCYIED